MLEANFGTQADVFLMEGVRLIWGPINTGFTVSRCVTACSYRYYLHVRHSLPHLHSAYWDNLCRL